MDILTLLRNPCQVLCEMSLALDFSDAFVMVRLKIGVLGKKTMEIKFHSYNILSRVCTAIMTYH
jgi:hypothetical protein